MGKQYFFDTITKSETEHWKKTNQTIINTTNIVLPYKPTIVDVKIGLQMEY